MAPASPREASKPANDANCSLLNWQEEKLVSEMLQREVLSLKRQLNKIKLMNQQNLDEKELLRRQNERLRLQQSCPANDE